MGVNAHTCVRIHKLYWQPGAGVCAEVSGHAKYSWKPGLFSALEELPAWSSERPAECTGTRPLRSDV